MSVTCFNGHQDRMIWYLFNDTSRCSRVKVNKIFTLVYRQRQKHRGKKDTIYQPLLNATLMSFPRQFKTHSDVDSCDSNSTHMTARWTNDPHVTSTTLNVWATSAEVKYRSTVSPVRSSWRSFKYIVLGFEGVRFEKEVTLYKQVYRQMLGLTLASAVISTFISHIH